MSEPVRVGVVGLGTMGRIHARNVLDCDHAVVAGADVSPACRDAFAEEFDVPVYDDHEALLAAEALDAVVITTPNKYHEPIAVAALEHEASVLVEKPLAHSLESAQRIVNAAERSPGFCMVGFHNRFSPAAATARAYVDADRFGELTHVEANYVRRRGIPGQDSWFTDRALAGGGALIDVGVHVIDLVLYLLDFPAVAEVVGVTRAELGAREDYVDPDGFGAGWDDDGADGKGAAFDVDDSVSAFLRCATGQTISLEVAWAANREPSNEVVLRGTEAGAHFEVGGDELELYETGSAGVDHHRTTTVTGSRDPAGHAAEIETFLDAVERGRPPALNTAAEGLAVQRAVEGVYRSSRTGRAVQLADRPTPTTTGHARPRSGAGAEAEE